MFKKVSSLFKSLRWFLTDIGMEIHRENVPCADGEHHTAYSLLRSARSREVWTFPEGNFFLLGRQNQLLEWAWLRSKGFKLMTDKPFDTKSIPFFTYYGKSSMVANMDLVSMLVEEDVAHLSQAEKEFFAWCKKNKDNLPQVHPGSRFGAIPTQEEECLAFLDLVRSVGLEPRSVSDGADLQ